MIADLASLYDVTVEPLYVQTHSSVYLHVHLGLTPAGGGVASTLARQAPEIREDLRVVYRTRPMSPHPATAHPRVPKVDRELVRRAFLDMGKTEAGAALQAKVPMAKVMAADVEDYVELREWGLEAFYVWPE